ncbi:Clr5 domain-containing protein [Fusarium sp. LHS14.1]|nr:Clr5 domain-containing protein [Fusarium sp. LHS14.1]
MGLNPRKSNLLLKAQYVRKLDSWGFKKNSSKEKWEHAAAVFRKRKSEVKETELRMNGKVISPKKLKKEFGRHAYMQSFSWVPPIEPGHDLEGVVARTPPSSLSSGFIMPNYLPWFQFQDYLASVLIPRSRPVFCIVVTRFSDLIGETER